MMARTCLPFPALGQPAGLALPRRLGDSCPVRVRVTGELGLDVTAKWPGMRQRIR